MRNGELRESLIEVYKILSGQQRVESVYFSLCQHEAWGCQVKLVGTGKLKEVVLCVGKSIWRRNLLLQNHI